MKKVLQKRGKKLLQGSLLTLLISIIMIIIGFLMFPFLVHNLGDKTYGLWVLVMTFIDYYMIMRMGFSSAVSRYLSRSVGKKDKEQMSKISSTSFFLYLIVSILMLIATLILIFLSKSLLNKTTDIILFQKLILILGINTAISPPLSVFGAILFAHMRYKASSVFSISSLLLKNVLIFIFISLDYGLIAIALIYLFCNILYSLGLFIYVKINFKFINIKLSHFKKEIFKTLFSYSFFTFVSQVSDKLRYRVDTVLITAYIGLSAVTHYNVGFNLIMYYIMIVSKLLLRFETYVSQEEGMNNYESIRNKFMFLTKLSTLLSVFIGTSLIFYGKQFISRWMGDSYIDSYNILLILVISSTILLAQYPTRSVLFGISKNKFWAYSNIIEGIANVGLSLLLVKKYGIIGVALGTTIPMLVMKIFIQPVYICKILKIDLKNYYKMLLNNIIKPLVFLTLYYLLVKNYLLPSYINLVIFAALQTVYFVLLCLSIFLKQKEKNYILEIIK